LSSISASIEGSLPENTASWQAKSERSTRHESLKSFRATQRDAYAENSKGVDLSALDGEEETVTH
jgi:hypothetical protein